MKQIGTLLGYNPEWRNNIDYITESVNRAAHYLAALGLNNWKSMHSVYVPFGRLQEKIDFDIGFGPPIMQLQLTPIPTDDIGYLLGFASQNAAEVPDQVSDNGGGAAAAA